MSISPRGSAEARSSVSPGSPGRGRNGGRRGSEDRAFRVADHGASPPIVPRYFPVDQDLLHLLLTVPRIPAGAPPNGRIRSPARRGRTVSGNVRPAASNTSASAFAARRFACAGVIFPLASQANVTIRPCCPSGILHSREWQAMRRNRCIFQCVRNSSAFSRHEECLFIPTGWPVSTPCLRSLVQRAHRWRRSRPSP